MPYCVLCINTYTVYLLYCMYLYGFCFGISYEYCIYIFYVYEASLVKWTSSRKRGGSKRVDMFLFRFSMTVVKSAWKTAKCGYKEKSLHIHTGKRKIIYVFYMHSNPAANVAPRPSHSVYCNLMYLKGIMYCTTVSYYAIFFFIST